MLSRYLLMIIRKYLVSCQKFTPAKSSVIFFISGRLDAYSDEVEYFAKYSFKQFICNVA